MFFKVYTIIVLILALIYYGYQIIKDLFLTKENTGLEQKPVDEEIDISDEAGQFQPILIEKDTIPPAMRQGQRVEEKPNEGNRADSNGNADGNVSNSGQFSDADDGASNRRSLSDVDNVSTPKPMDAKTKANIDSIVGKLRKQIEEEENAGSVSTAENRNESETIEDDDTDKPKDNDTDSISLEESDVLDDDTDDESVSSDAEPRRELATFEMRVYIDDDVVHTHVCGSQTAEEVHTEAVRASKDDALMALKSIESDWIKQDDLYKKEEAEQAFAAQEQSEKNPRVNTTFAGLEE